MMYTKQNSDNNTANLNPMHGCRSKLAAEVTVVHSLTEIKMHVLIFFSPVSNILRYLSKKNIRRDPDTWICMRTMGQGQQQIYSLGELLVKDTRHVFANILQGMTAYIICPSSSGSTLSFSMLFSYFGLL